MSRSRPTKPRSASRSDEALREHGLSRPLDMLVRISGQCHLGDPDACATLLGIIQTNRLIHQYLQGVLAGLGLTELKFITLVGLYAIDPEPATPALLADQAQVSRSAMTDTLDAMLAKNWILRAKATGDRRMIHIRLTELGRDIVEHASHPFLSAVDHCARSLTRAEREVARRVCARLQELLVPST